MTDDVYVVFNYFDGPIEGLASYEGRVFYFDTPFREDIDEYDCECLLMEITPDEETAMRSLLAEGHEHFGDSKRTRLWSSIRARYLAKLASGTCLVRVAPKFWATTRGALRHYSVDWSKVTKS